MAVGEASLVKALRPWEYRLVLESLERWLIRAAIASFVVAVCVLLIGWVTPMPESELRPWALQLGALPLVVSALVALVPKRHRRQAAELDRRLQFGDRLATAWAFRASDQPIVQLQRADALSALQRRAPQKDLTWRPARLELAALSAVAFVTLLLLITPSPQQKILDQRAAEELEVQQASQSLDVLRQEAVAAQSLTPEQASQLNELLKQAQEELNRTRTQQEASAVLARVQDQVAQQLGDPNADLRDAALAAMSETLAAEPRTRALADALQQEDAQAASDAIRGLEAQADQLSDIERQSLSRALQRAANVGRSEPRTAGALRDASQALGSNLSSQEALTRADAALREAIRASQSQASLNATVQRLRDLQSQVASGAPLQRADSSSAATGFVTPGASGVFAGTPVALDASRGSRTVTDPTPGQDGRGAGVGAPGSSYQTAGSIAGQAAENVFVPGRPGTGQSDQDLVDQPFTVRGAPRPYRDVLSQYAQSSRDYVDRPDISPAVRDLVKQYFQELEQGN
jgi:hypothetical protein